MRNRLNRRGATALAGTVIGVLGAVVVARSPTTALAIAFAAPVLLLTSLRTKVLGALILLPLVGWLIVQVPGSATRAIPDAILFVILGHLAWEWTTARIRLPIGRPFVVLVLLFAGVVFVQIWNPIIHAVGGGLTGGRSYLAPFCMFLAGLAVIRGKVDAGAVLKSLVVSSLFVNGYMLKQLFGGFDVAEKKYWSSSTIGIISEHKLFSTLVSPDSYGFMAAVLVIACLAARHAGVWPRISLLGALLSGLGVLVCGIRIALAGLVVGGVAYLIAQFRSRQSSWSALRFLLLAGAALLVLLISVIATPVQPRYAVGVGHNPTATAVNKLALFKQGTADPDLESRIVRAREFFAYIVRHPWGAGPEIIDALTQSTLTIDQSGGLTQSQSGTGTVSARPPPLPAYMLDQPWIFQHDYFYFDLAVELGLLPLILFVLLLVRSATLAFREARSSVGEPEIHSLLCLAGGGILIALVVNLTNETLRAAETSSFLWFFMAMPIALAVPAGRKSVAAKSATGSAS
jgi:hypothetical protein